MVEWVNVAEESRVGLEEIMVEANEILTGLPLTRHDLILALLLSASPQRERARSVKKVRRHIMHVTCYSYSRKEEGG